MRANLDEAIGALAHSVRVDVVDVGDLKEADYRTGYGTPTILLNGADLLGVEKPAAAAPT